MKTSHILLLAAAISPAAFFSSGCSQSADTPTMADKASSDAKSAVDSVKMTAANSWNSIKDYTYEKRTDFSAGLGRMAGQLDDKTRDMKSASRTDYDTARADLQSKLDDLSSATAANWDTAKQKAADSWTRLQAAYDKMKSGATS